MWCVTSSSNKSLRSLISYREGLNPRIASPPGWVSPQLVELFSPSRNVWVYLNLIWGFFSRVNPLSNEICPRSRPNASSEPGKYVPLGGKNPPSLLYQVLNSLNEKRK